VSEEGIIRHMVEPLLRPATLEDAPALAETVCEGFESYREWAPRGWDPPGREHELRGIRDRLPNPGCVCVLAEAGGEPAGQVAIVPARDEPGVAHVWMLFLRRAWWGTGLAATLLAQGVEEARSAGFAAMRLLTPAEHRRARRFYEREGWWLDGEPFYEPMLGLTLVRYRRSLG
jgi:GNAT superfamily N-acetyltransferase